jgi:hypothetical protein
VHEEFRLRLESDKEVRLAGIQAQREVAESQAKVLATGLENADIDIIGGESMFLDRLMGSMTLGKSVDGFMNGSDVASKLAGPWLNGDANFADDIKQILSSLGSDDVKNLSISAALMKMMKEGGPRASRIEELLSGAPAVTPAPVERVPEIASQP